MGAPVDGDAGRAHIAILAVEGTGATVAYRKMWLGTAESNRFAPGSKPAVLDVDGWRLGLAICKDTGIPQHASDTAAAQTGPEPGAAARATIGGAMSDTLTAEKLEVARRFWEAFSGEPITLERLNAGLADSLLDEFFAPDAVLDMSALEDWPESPLYEGHAGIRRFWEAWFGTWEETTWELERLEAVGDLVLSVVLQRGIGGSSRTPVEWRTCYLATIRGSKIVRSLFFADPDDAIRAAGGGAGGG